MLARGDGKFCVKRLMANTGIPPSICEKTVCRVLQKAGLKWNHVQRKGILTKNDLKLRFKFTPKVRRKRAMCNYEIGNHQKTYGTGASRSRSRI